MDARISHMTGLLLASRALRAFADGFIAVLLPAYLLALGHGQIEVGFLGTAPLVACGLLKIAYDLALFAAFRRASPRG